MTNTSWWIREVDLRWDGKEGEERMSLIIVFVGVSGG